MNTVTCTRLCFLGEFSCQNSGECTTSDGGFYCKCSCDSSITECEERGMSARTLKLLNIISAVQKPYQNSFSKILNYFHVNKFPT